MKDPGRVVLRRALRVAVVMPLTYILCAYVLNVGDSVAYAAFGVFALLGICDFGGPTRDRATAYLLTGAGGCVAIAIGSAVAYNVYAAVLVTFIVGAAISFSTLLRGYFSSAQMGVLLPFVIAATATPEIGKLPVRIAVFALATVICTVAALVLWPSHSRSQLRSRVADTLTATAALTAAMWPTGDEPVVDVQTRQRELRQASLAMRAQYEGRLMRPGKATSRDRSLMRLVDELTRLRFLLRWQPRDEADFSDDERALARRTTAVLYQCADALRGKAAPPDPAELDAAREEHRLLSEERACRLIETGQTAAVEQLLDTSFHLRTSALEVELVAAYTQGSVGQEPDLSSPTAAGVSYVVPRVSTRQILATNLSLRSPWLQLALRTGLALALAVGVVFATQVDHGFWVVLGTISALRLDAAGTGRTAVQAIIGTVAGFVIGSLIVLIVGDVTAVYWVLLPIAAFLSAYTPSLVSIPVGQASFTVFVIVFYGILAGPTLQTGEIRVLDIAIGLTISLIVSALMWPRGIKRQVATSLRTAMHAATATLLLAYDRLLNGPVTEPALTESAQRAINSLVLANETFDLAIAQAGPNTDLGDSWSFVANSAGHVFGCSSLITFLARGAGAQITSVPVRDAVLSCTHTAVARLNATVDDIHDDFSNVRTNTEYEDEHFLAVVLADSRGQALGADFSRLNEAVSAAIGELAAKSRTGVSVKSELIGTVYARDWLFHIGWLANRLAEVTRRDQPVAETNSTTPN